MQPRKKDIEKAYAEGVLEKSCKLLEISYTLHRMAEIYQTEGDDILKEYNLTRGELNKLWNKVCEATRAYHSYFRTLYDDSPGKDPAKAVIQNVEENLLPIATCLGVVPHLVEIRPSHNVFRYLPDNYKEQPLQSVTGHIRKPLKDALQAYSKAHSMTQDQIISELVSSWCKSQVVSAALKMEEQNISQ